MEMVMVMVMVMRERERARKGHLLQEIGDDGGGIAAEEQEAGAAGLEA
jgi:hypothetical protein